MMERMKLVVFVVVSDDDSMVDLDMLSKELVQSHFALEQNVIEPHQDDTHQKVMEILLEAVDFQNRKQEPRQPSLQKSECLGSMVRGAPASARVRRLPREGTRTPSTWRRWMGDVAPSFHRLLFCEVAPPQECLDSVRVVYSPPPLVYALSWLGIVAAVLALKVLSSMGRNKFSAALELTFRLLKYSVVHLAVLRTQRKGRQGQGHTNTT